MPPRWRQKFHNVIARFLEKETKCHNFHEEKSQTSQRNARASCVVAALNYPELAFLRGLCSSNPAEQQNTVARRVEKLQKTCPKMAPKSA